MKSEKSKKIEEVPSNTPRLSLQSIFGKKPIVEEKLDKKDKKVKIVTTKERVGKILGAVGKFFVVFFILVVIFSMIAIPLLVVFGG